MEAQGRPIGSNQTDNQEGKSETSRREVIQPLQIESILKESSEVDLEALTYLLTTPARNGREALGYLLYSDMENLMNSLQSEYPHIFTIEEIGRSYEQRPIRMLTMDARAYIVQQEVLNLTSKNADTINQEDKKPTS